MSTWTEGRGRGGFERDALLDDLLEVSLELLGHLALANLGEEALLRRREVLLERLLPRANLLDGDAVEETVDTARWVGWVCQSTRSLCVTSGWDAQVRVRARQREAKTRGGPSDEAPRGSPPPTWATRREIARKNSPSEDQRHLDLDGERLAVVVQVWRGGASRVGERERGRRREGGKIWSAPTTRAPSRRPAHAQTQKGGRTTGPA